MIFVHAWDLFGANWYSELKIKDKSKLGDTLESIRVSRAFSSKFRKNCLDCREFSKNVYVS